MEFKHLISKIRPIKSQQGKITYIPSELIAFESFLEIFPVDENPGNSLDHSLALPAEAAIPEKLRTRRT